MIALVRFLLKSYTRKHAYFAPLAATLIAMFLLYSYKPNPVMDSYAVTSVFLFIGAAWLGLTFLNHGSPQQEQLHIIHIGSMKKYLFSQILALLIPVILLTVIFIVFPILTHMFNRPVYLNELLMAICGHVILGILGFMLSLFFQTAWMPNGARAIAIMLIVVIVSLGAKSIIARLPFPFAWIRWILPPVSPIMDGLINSTVFTPEQVWGAIGYGLVYILLLYLIYMFISVRRDART
ncbi:hypothetical protein J23TS9_24100 [Paenibacillus sp. J23TS9]|uniref:hypothetical protein n=1 Tax=Paenibacillus sp. J23TS9 TaxID=2807193 RepID=UPI001B0CA6DE|nr:hypothetical protein [Paenibacillus sp. J23TS9]GIP27280.1 hypothetical protein J23TS9_24100 [Paenibacillus sp. J23TS9]